MRTLALALALNWFFIYSPFSGTYNVVYGPYTLQADCQSAQSMLGAGTQRLGVVSACFNASS